MISIIEEAVSGEIPNHGVTIYRGTGNEYMESPRVVVAASGLSVADGFSFEANEYQFSVEIEVSSEADGTFNHELYCRGLPMAIRHALTDQEIIIGYDAILFHELFLSSIETQNTDRQRVTNFNYNATATIILEDY
jgi:hypothetical protein